MALTLEAPSTESLDTHAAAAAMQGLKIANPEAEAAVSLLDADGDVDGDVDGVDIRPQGQEGDEQRDDSTPITIRLVKEVEDKAAGFSGSVGEILDAYVDVDGNTWIPLATGDICLEAEEFEAVEPLASQEADASPELTAIVAEPVAAIPPAVETPAPAAETAATAASASTSAPPAADYDTRRRDYLRQKDILQEQISALMIEQSKLKEQAKRCKKEAEVYVEQLDELIESWEHPAPQGLSLCLDATGPAHDGSFADRGASTTRPEPAAVPDAPQPSTDTLQATATATAKPRTEAQTQAAYRRALESAPISQLGISEALQEKLAEAGAENLWTLEQLRSEISLGKAKWPKGIGAAKVTAIEDAIMGWMSRNSESWDPVQGGNDAAEAAADESRAADVAESQPGQPEVASPAVSSDIDDL